MNLEQIDKNIQKAIFQIQKGETLHILSQVYMHNMQQLNFHMAKNIIRIIQFIPSEHYQQSTVNFLNKICDKIYRFYDMYKSTHKLLKIFKTICLNSFLSNTGFQQFHITFLKIVIQNRYYKHALDIIKYPMIKIQDLKAPQILQYLYYSGIIFTVLRQYDNAVQSFTKILQIEKQQTNMKIDAYKKLFLLNCLLGRHTLYQLQKTDMNPYMSLLGLANGEDTFNYQSLPFKKIFIQDGNNNLAQKIEYVNKLNKLQQFSSSHLRLPLVNLQYLQLSKPEIILILNEIRNLYKYDPRNNCIVFDKEQKNIEEEISKVVQLFLSIRKQEQNKKKKKDQFFRRL